MPTRLAKGLKNGVIKRIFPALIFGMKLRAIGKRTRSSYSYHFNRAVRRKGEGFKPICQTVSALAMQRVHLEAAAPDDLRQPAARQQEAPAAAGCTTLVRHDRVQQLVGERRQPAEHLQLGHDGLACPSTFAAHQPL